MPLVSYDDSSDSDPENFVKEVRCCSRSASRARIKIIKPVKIQIPALVPENSPRERAIKRKKSCLTEILPPPKAKPTSSLNFIPNVLQRKPNDCSTNPLNISVGAVVDLGDKDEDSDDAETLETFDDDTWQKVCGKQNRPSEYKQREFLSKTCSEIEPAPEISKPYAGLDNRAFKELVGKPKNLKQNFGLIEIYEDDIKPDKSEWLKSLTDPAYESKSIIDNPVNTTCKIKNHITSLAQSALADDKELQMRWAENRHKKAQTRAKYGF